MQGYYVAAIQIHFHFKSQTYNKTPVAYKATWYIHESQIRITCSPNFY